MPVARQELELGAGYGFGFYGVWEGGGVVRIEPGLEGSGKLEVRVDVLDAGFVECNVGFSQREEVHCEGLGGLASGW